MPTYVYECQECHLEFEQVLRISECDAAQACPACQGATKKLVAPVSFILQGDGWPGKAIKVKGQMAEKNRRLDAKTPASPVRLAPNVEGERVDSWSEAKKLAASKGKDTTSYDKQIREEIKP